MTDTMGKDAFNAFLQEVDSTAGFEVKFTGDRFEATNGLDRVCGVVTDDGENNVALANRVASTLRYPPQPRGPVVGKERAFKGPPLNPQEKFREKLELLKRQGSEDERTKMMQLLQSQHPRPDLPRGITYEPMWVTPEQAEEWLLAIGGVVLDDRPVQRPLSWDTAKKYADLMLQGAWGLSPDPFAFDRRGLGFNGMHRWAALVYTGMTLPFFYSHGWEDLEAFQYLDKQLKRTTATTLALKGHAKARDLSAAASLLAKAKKAPLVAGWTTKLRVDEAQVLHVVETRPMLEKAVEWASSAVPTFLHRGALAVARCLAAEVCGPLDANGEPIGDWDATAKYFNGLKNGSGIVENEPAYAMRNYFATMGKGAYVRKAERRTIDKGGLQTAYFLTGWNLAVKREALTRPSLKIDYLEIPKPLRPMDAPAALFTAPHVRNP